MDDCTNLPASGSDIGAVLVLAAMLVGTGIVLLRSSRWHRGTVLGIVLLIGLLVGAALLAAVGAPAVDATAGCPDASSGAGGAVATTLSPSARTGAVAGTFTAFGWTRDDCAQWLVGFNATGAGVLAAPATRPVPAAEVTVRDGTGTVVGSASTALDGTYAVTGLAPGGYTVATSVPEEFQEFEEYIGGVDPDIWYCGVSAFPQPAEATVTVAAGAAAIADFSVANQAVAFP